MELPFAENAQQRGQHVRRVVKGKEVLSRSRSDCLVLISDTNFEILSLALQQNIRSYSWFQLTKISTSNDTLHISFGKNSLSFLFSDLKPIYTTICDILPRILTSSELKTAGFKSLNAFIAKPTGKSALLRLEEKMKDQSSGIQEILSNTLTEISQFSYKRVDLSNVDEPLITMPILLDVLPLVNTVREIKVPNIKKLDSYQLISSFVSNQSGVEHITVDGNLTKNFERYLHNIEGNDSLQLFGLTFSNSNFEAKNFDALQYTMKFKEIKSLGMQNAFNTENSKYFYKVFLRGLTNKLLYLNLDQTKTIDFTSIFTYCKDLQCLSLVGCKTEISKLLQHFTEKNCPNLYCLDISDNECSKSVSKTLKLTPSLFTIKADRVKWKNHTVAEFFETLIHSCTRGLFLSFSDANMSMEEWIRVFSFFRQTSYIGLCSLIWKGNPIHSRLFEFLSKNKEMIHLDLTDCFKQPTKEPIDSLIKYLAKQQNLKSLILKSTNGKTFLTSFLPQIFESIEQSKSIQHLDISNQCGGNSILQYIIQLLDGKSQIDTIVFDGNEPEDETVLLQLLQQSTKTKTSAAVSFPSKDINLLLSQGKITNEQIEAIKNQISFEPCKSTSDFDAPFYLYKDEESDNLMFPTYLKEEIDLSSIPKVFLPENTNTIDVIETDEEMKLDLEISDSSKTKRSKKHKSPRKSKKKKPKSPQKEANIEENQQVNVPAVKEEPQKQFKVVPVKKKSNVSEAKKDQLSDVPVKEEENKQNMPLQVPPKDVISPKKIQETQSTEPKTHENKQKKPKKSSSKHSKRSRKKSQSTINDDNLTLQTLDHISLSDENLDIPATIEEPISNDSTPKPFSTAKIDNIQWTVPIKFTFFGRNEYQWRKSQKVFSLERIMYDIRNEKK